MSIKIGAAQSSVFPSADALDGEWHGVFQCDGYTNQFSVRLQSNGAQLAGPMQRSILGPTFKKHQQPYAKSLQIIGQYDSQTGTIALATGQGRGQEIVIRGVVGEDGDRLAGTVQWSLGRGCSGVVMGKRFERTVASIVSAAKPVLYRPKVDGRVSCDANVVEWMSQPLNYDQYSYQLREAAAFGSLALFADDRFKPFFGKSFSKMSKRDLAKLENQIARSCWGNVQAIGGDAKTATHALNVVRQLPGTRLNVALYAHARDIARSWQAHAIASADPANQQQVSRLTNAARLFTQTLWPEGGFNFSAQLAEKKSAAGTQSMQAALDALLADPTPSFETLEQVAAFDQGMVVGSVAAMESPNRVTRRSRQEQAAAQQAAQAANAEARASFVVTAEAATAALERIRTYTNAHIVDAAAAFAAQQTTPAQVRTQLVPLRQRSASQLGNYVAPAQARQVSAIFSAQRQQQAAQFAAAEQQQFVALNVSADATLAGLGALNAAYRRWQQTYGELLKLDAFAPLLRDAATNRMRILDSVRLSLVAQVAQADTVTALERMLDEHVLPIDRNSRAFAPIAQAAATRRQSLAPFTGYPGDTYLNAIYAGDLRTIDTIDVAYRNRFKQALSEFGGAGVFDNFYRYAIDQITFIEPIMAVYLLNYQKNFKRCLRADAARFTVTRTVPTTVTTNLLGIEIARSEGYTLKDDFWVNAEFVGAFRQVGKMQPTNLVASLVDQYVGSGGIGAVTSGTRKMLREQDCNGPVMQRMEERMRAVLFR